MLRSSSTVNVVFTSRTDLQMLAGNIYTVRINFGANREKIGRKESSKKLFPTKAITKRLLKSKQTAESSLCSNMLARCSAASKECHILIKK